ncbi:MAG: acylphosphatase [candidate division WOR-3 bacterium]|nr:acylphosphatase [candidate division WOR-3 bacterium]
MSDARLHAVICGVVQGVNFRYFTVRLAKRLNLTGWVRNLGYERVETVAEGEKDALNAFLDELKVGPISARVTKVDIEWQKPTHEFDDFRVTYEEW